MGSLEDWLDVRDQRIEQRMRQLGTRDPVCSRPGCAERDPFALTGLSPNLVCGECQAKDAGRSPVEGHHVKGRHNDADDVIDVPVNDHRSLSEAQQHQWPVDTLRNPQGSPVLRAAAALRGWLDVLRLILERTVGWIPAFLERLDATLVVALGERYWIRLGLA